MFQSAPGPKARGNPASHSDTLRRSVSIRPRPEGQGKRLVRVLQHGVDARFQSAPGPKARGNARGAGGLGRASPFQSAPGPKARGNSKLKRCVARWLVFQSAPGPKARGNWPVMLLKSRVVEFQSAPGPKARGNKRRGGRLPDRLCFNPPPARRPGETRDCGRGHAAGGRVSIRPRPEGQGKPPQGHDHGLRHEVSIRPRPEGQGKPDMSVAERPQNEFQSAPGPKARGNQSCICLAPTPFLFQSAPGPKARGNRASGDVEKQRTHVSIRPRPEGQGKRRDVAVAEGPQDEFQSAPGPKARGNPAALPPMHRPASFNPPPARRPGETPFRFPLSEFAVEFQSAPGPKARGNERCDVQGLRPVLVSIRPRPEGQGKLDLQNIRDTGKTGFNPPPARRPGETSTRT